MKRFTFMALFLMSISMFIASQAFGATICATTDSQDDDCSDGSCYLQSALDEAMSNDEADEIRVEQGVYFVPEDSVRAAFDYDSTDGKDITIKGGYDSGCTQQTLNPENTIIDAQGILYLGALDVTQANGGDIYIEGITTQNSNKWNVAALNANTKITGPGQGGDIKIFQCICQGSKILGGLSATSVEYGDGFTTGTVTVEECTIRNNQDGGLFATTFTNHGTANEVRVINNVISSNELHTNRQNNCESTAAKGGSVSDVTVQGNKITGNTLFGGLLVAITPGPGDASGEGIHVIGNTISNNSGWGAGGLTIEAPASSTSGNAGATVHVINNIIAHNHASQGHGGGVLITSTNVTIDGNEAPRNIAYNTITGNTSDKFTECHGVHLSGRFDTVHNLHNNIIWGNGQDGYDLYVWGVESTVNLYNNDFGGMFKGKVNENHIINQSGNIDENPDFDGTLRLNETSPCIDVGTNNTPVTTATDIDGDVRVINYIPDMGADEYSTSAGPEVDIWNDPNTAPVQVVNGNLVVEFNYSTPVFLLVGVMNETFTETYWLSSDCVLDERFAMVVGTEFNCNIPLPGDMTTGWLFWMISPISLADLNWTTDAYQLHFYAF